MGVERTPKNATRYSVSLRKVDSRLYEKILEVEQSGNDKSKFTRALMQYGMDFLEERGVEVVPEISYIKSLVNMRIISTPKENEVDLSNYLDSLESLNSTPTNASVDVERPTSVEIPKSNLKEIPSDDDIEANLFKQATR